VSRSESDMFDAAGNSEGFGRGAHAVDGESSHARRTDDARTRGRRTNAGDECTAHARIRPPARRRNSRRCECSRVSTSSLRAGRRAARAGEDGSRDVRVACARRRSLVERTSRIRERALDSSADRLHARISRDSAASERDTTLAPSRRRAPTLAAASQLHDSNAAERWLASRRVGSPCVACAWSLP